MRSPGKRAGRAAPAEGRKPQRAAASPGAAIKMSPLLLAPELPLGEAFQRIIGGCLGHLAANRQLLSEPGVEAVHQMRVAVRRLRSACALFEPLIGHPRPLAALQDELRWLGRCLGRVRDWDVLLTRMLPANTKATHRLRERAEARRAMDRKSLERVLAGRRFMALLRGLESLAGVIAAKADTQREVFREAALLLSRLDRRVRKAGRGFRELTTKERHALRKKLRKLHYGLGFLASLFPRRQVERFTKRTRRLQGMLGDLNDIAGSTRLLKEIARGLPAGRSAPLSADPDWKGLRRSWRCFRKADRFWL